MVAAVPPRDRAAVVIAVAGGGPAGATAAMLLARAGRLVTVYERTDRPTAKICGEFLSGEAAQILGSAGFDVAELGGHEIRALRLIRGERCVRTDLPFVALGISRMRLDEALLQHAERCGAVVRRGCSVARTEAATLVFSDRTTTAPQTLLLATGKHDVRGVRRAAQAEDLVGFKMHFDMSARALRELSGHVEIILFRDAYVGLQRIEDGRANVCLLVRRAALEASGGTWESLRDDLCRQSAHLRRRLAGAQELLPRPLTIYRVPYGFVHAPVAGEAAFRLGDQAAVIPSFAGDGMAIALHSAALASRMILSGDDASAYHRRLRRHVGGQVQRAWHIYRLGTRPAGQAAMMLGATLCPAMLRGAAALTRVSARALGQT